MSIVIISSLPALVCIFLAHILRFSYTQIYKLTDQSACDRFSYIEKGHVLLIFFQICRSLRHEFEWNQDLLTTLPCQKQRSKVYSILTPLKESIKTTWIHYVLHIFYSHDHHFTCHNYHKAHHKLYWCFKLYFLYYRNGFPRHWGGLLGLRFNR